MVENCTTCKHREEEAAIFTTIRCEIWTHKVEAHFQYTTNARQISRVWNEVRCQYYEPRKDENYETIQIRS